MLIPEHTFNKHLLAVITGSWEWVISWLVFILFNMDYTLLSTYYVLAPAACGLCLNSLNFHTHQLLYGQTGAGWWGRNTHPGNLALTPALLTSLSLPMSSCYFFCNQKSKIFFKWFKTVNIHLLNHWSALIWICKHLMTERLTLLLIQMKVTESWVLGTRQDAMGNIIEEMMSSLQGL